MPLDPQRMARIKAQAAAKKQGTINAPWTEFVSAPSDAAPVNAPLTEYVSAAPPPPVLPKPGFWESLGLGASEFLKQPIAAMSEIYGLQPPGYAPKPVGESYDSLLAAQNQADKAAEDEYPITYNVGRAGPALVAGALTAGMGLGPAMVAGAATNTAQVAGGSPVNVRENPGEYAKDVALAGPIGAGATAVGAGAAKVGGAVAGKLGSTARRIAGGNLGKSVSPSEADEIGAALFKHKAVGGTLFGNSQEEIAEKLGPLTKKYGAAVGQALDDLEAEAARQGYTPDLDEIATMVESRLLKNYTGLGSELAEETIEPVNKVASTLRSYPEKSNFKELRQFVRNVGDKADFPGEAAPAADKTRAMSYGKVYGALKEGTQVQGRRVSPALQKALDTADAEFSPLRQAQRISAQGSKTAVGGRSIGAMNWIQKMVQGRPAGTVALWMDRAGSLAKALGVSTEKLAQIGLRNPGLQEEIEQLMAQEPGEGK